MCGICGIFSWGKGRSGERHLIQKMAKSMVHRGPDECGFYHGARLSFGHQRLCIIDAERGQQPMELKNKEKNLVIVYNGEIYNYRDLGIELKKKGHTFKTNCDTEVVLAAYSQWGKACVSKLRGMFAFAIWDKNQRMLFVARDRMGIKPLYYFEGSDFFAFASEIKAILACQFAENALAPSTLDSFLTLGYVPAPMTFFQGIRKVLPAHTICVDEGGNVNETCYWSLKDIQQQQLTFSEAEERLEDLLRECVRIRLMSEVPLGVFLSGGLDSSTITALMSEVSAERIKTFSVGYENAGEADELLYARKVADLFETEHHEFVMGPYDFLDSIRDLVKKTEEPLVETAAIPLYQLSKQAKKYATVLLSGEGSDEVFAGYGLYGKMLKIEKMRFLLNLLRFYPKRFSPGDKINKYIDWISSPIRDSYRGTSADLTWRIRRSFYSPDFLEIVKRNGYLDETFHKWFDDVEQRDILTQLLFVDSKTWLPDDLLLKADKMTMATSVELRVPFLDHKIVEFAASLPSNFKICNGEGKFILKKLMEKYLPKEIIYRKKMGFAVPTKRWFAGDLLGPAKDIIFSKRLMDTGWFQKKYLETMFERHRKGKEDYSRRIFSLLVLYHWLDIYA